MTAQPQVDRIGTEAFRALQAKARDERGGDTQPLLVVYALESFLRRLAISEYAHQMVLKGGMLMAFSRVREMTRDADLSTHGLANEEEQVRGVIARICALEPDPPDGVVIDPSTIRTETMREQDEYRGVRCKLVATLGRARIPFALDLSFGDPGEATVIELRSVLDRAPVLLDAYPLTLNLAEKIVTAMQRRETSTRDRDMPDRQQSYAAMVERMSYLSPPPERWSELIAGVIDFIDPLLADEEGRLSYWDPDELAWAFPPPE